MNGHSLSRGYRRHLQRLEELERMLRYLIDEIEAIAEVSLPQLAADADRAADAAAAAAAAAVSAAANASADTDIEASGSGGPAAAAAAGAAGAAAAAAKPQTYMLDKVEEMLNKVYGQFLRFAQNNKDLQREKAAAVNLKP